MQKLRKNDEIIVIAGRSKGARGRVTKLLGTGNDRKVLVEQVNMVKKHVKPNPQAGEPGGIKEKEAALDISNVAIWNPSTQKADRVAIKVSKDSSGKETRQRVFKSNQEVIG